MREKLELHPDRLFSSDPIQRSISRRIYEEIHDMPILSPHGHTDPSWFALNDYFPNPSQLLISPDHYVFRMLYSQGIALENLGIPTVDGTEVESDGRKIWRTFAKHYHLFRGTPSQIWLDWVFAEVFGITVKLNEETADEYYDYIEQCLQTDPFRPRSLFDRFNIEVLSTTESALDKLEYHKQIAESSWNGRVISAYRPDNVSDPECENFLSNLKAFSELTGCDTTNWQGYLDAHRKRRQFFKETGNATASDHGFANAVTADLSHTEAQALFARIVSGSFGMEDAKLFRGQMLKEFARMSLDDGLTMQIHLGTYRDHNKFVSERFGSAKGGDIPMQTEFTHALKPMLDAVGNERDLTIILFTLDEDTYSRELAPLAGHYPALRLGPPWWFHDSPEGIRRFRERSTETAGFYNTVGFNDDTRAFLSIPSRHDLARRMDCVWLAQLVAEHRMDESSAIDMARDLTYHLAKKAYKL